MLPISSSVIAPIHVQINLSIVQHLHPVIFNVNQNYHAQTPPFNVTIMIVPFYAQHQNHVTRYELIAPKKQAIVS